MSQSKFEDALLEHARRDRPSPAKRRAAKAAFLASATIATGAATTSTAAAATVKGAAASSLSTTTLVKLAIAIAVGSGGVAGVVAVRSNTERASPAAAPSASVVHVAMASATAPPPLPASVEIDDLPIEAAPKPKPAKPPEVEDGLVGEARLLEQARACLARSDFACTEQRLASHEKRFGARGALFEEARILGIESAKKSGDRETLRARANAFLAERPSSSYVPRVRAALQSLEEKNR